MASEVLDPAILGQLNAQEVTDPAALAHLEGTSGSSADSYTPIATPDPNSTYPVGSELGAMLQNAWTSFGRTWPSIGSGAQQIFAQARDKLTGSNTYAPLQAAEAERRHLDAPLDADLGGKIGALAGYAPFMMLPGADTVGGAAAIGAGLGALRPTTPTESREFNTAVGGAFGAGGSLLGKGVANWLENRAAQPFMGWNLSSGNKAAAAAVGSDADKLDQPAIAAAQRRFTQIFGAARSQNVTVPVGGQTASVISKASAGLNQSSATALSGNAEVQDLMALLRSGSGTAKQLGDISTKLQQESSTLMTSKGGDRALGIALSGIKEHVDDMIGQSIIDPTLRAAYDLARPQYRTFTTLTQRPTLLNSSTGDINLLNLGKYLQKYDKVGYTRGLNQTPLYQAARFGQASGIGSRPPPPILQPFKFAMYHALNNPISGAVGGTVSRIGAPVAPALPRLAPWMAAASGQQLLTDSAQ